MDFQRFRKLLPSARYDAVASIHRRLETDVFLTVTHDQQTGIGMPCGEPQESLDEDVFVLRPAMFHACDRFDE